jgi:DNA-binding MarR family transcriptional regulator
VDWTGVLSNLAVDRYPVQVALPDTTARDQPENLAILLREPFRRMDELLVDRLAERGHGDVRSAHGAVFQYLDDAGTPVSELARRAGIAKQSMAELVQHLERTGYVERVPDPRDARARLVRSTAKGREVFAVARELVAELDARVAQRLGEARLADLRGLLEELLEALPGRAP